MKITKLLALILIMTGFTQCKSTKFDKTPPFTVTEATYTNWVGGIKGVRGVNVVINYTSSSEVKFDSIYFINKVIKIEFKSVKEQQVLVGHFNTSSVNSKEDLVLHADSTKELKNTIPSLKKFPFELKENEAVISYQEGKKTKYFKVENIKVGKSVFYQ